MFRNMENEELENEEDEKEIENRKKEIYESEVIKNLNLDNVCRGFEKADSIDKLKENMVFNNLFEYVWLDIDPLNRDFEDDFFEKYARDIFLLTKWYEHMSQTTEKTKDVYLNNVFQLLLDLYKYTGSNLHDDLDFSSIIEVMEMRIIKSGLTADTINLIMKSLNEFCNFLEKNNIKYNMDLLDEEDIKDLQRVAREFKEGVWEENKEDYEDWRERNITYYF